MANTKETLQEGEGNSVFDLTTLFIHLGLLMSIFTTRFKEQNELRVKLVQMVLVTLFYNSHHSDCYLALVYYAHPWFNYAVVFVDGIVALSVQVCIIIGDSGNSKHVKLVYFIHPVSFSRKI